MSRRLLDVRPTRLRAIIWAPGCSGGALFVPAQAARPRSASACTQPAFRVTVHEHSGQHAFADLHLLRWLQAGASHSALGARRASLPRAMSTDAGGFLFGQPRGLTFSKKVGSLSLLRALNP